MTSSSCRTSSQGGFTLLEVLIAVVVLGLGLLGLAALQVNALQSASISYQRSIATLAAQDAAERLWGYLLASDDYYGEPDNTLREIKCPDDDTGDSELDAIEAAWEAEWAPAGARPWAIPWKDDATKIDIAELSACEYRITLSWVDERLSSDEGDISTLTYTLGLPAEG